MTKKQKEYSKISDVNSWKDFYNRHTIYEGTYGERMLKTLVNHGYNLKELAGIYDVIKKEHMLWDEFINTNWNHTQQN